MPPTDTLEFDHDAMAAFAAPSGSPLWLCWTSNCRGKHGLYVIHATTDTGRLTLCGCRVQEFGGIKVDSENQPGCKRCRRILANTDSATPR